MLSVELSIKCSHMHKCKGDNAKDMWRAVQSISYKRHHDIQCEHVVDTLPHFNVRDAPRCYWKVASVMSAGSGSSVNGVDVLELGLGVTGVAMPDADSDIKRTL
jgi:hypothetical protein